MTKIEKIIVGVIALIIVVWLGLVVSLSNAIEDAGGVKQVIIDVGREVKDIAHEIEKE